MNLTAMPDNELARKDAWEKLTSEDGLLARLQQCVNERTNEATFQGMQSDLEAWDAWQREVRIPKRIVSSYQHQSHAARILIQLAQIAAHQPALSAEQLLEQTDSGFDAAWRWDAYRALSGNARKPLLGTQQSVSVLLEQDELGCLARLETELIADGTGQLYADPTANAFLEFEAETFLAGAREVWELVKRQFVESADQERLAAVDVRFRLIRLPVPNYRNPQLHRISGRSAQAAFFLSLFQTAGAYLGRSEALLLEDTLAASATILPSGVLGSVAALESKLTAAYLSGLAVVVVSKADEVEAQKALRDASAHDKEDKVRPLTTEVVGLGTTTELLDFLRDRAKEREAVRHYEQKKCCKLNILDREVEIEAYYQALPLLREVKKKRLPRSERKGREADEERERDDEFTTLRGMTLQRWEEALSQEQVIYQEQQRSLDEVLNNFRAVVEEARSAVPRFFVLGPPGSGKTTLVQYLGWRATNRTLEVCGHQLLPARVSLRRWESFCADAKRSLPEYLAEHYRTLPHPPTAQQWQSWLQRGEALLLLDGLDEVDGRAVFIEALTEALSTYTECPAIITCRTVSFEQHRKLTPDFPVFTLAELGDELRDKYIHAFPAGRHFDAHALIEQLNRTPQMRPLTANPLLLSIICYVVDDPHGVSLPATRTELYNKVVEKLLTRKWVDIPYDGDEPDPDEKRVILERVALGLFAKGERKLSFTGLELGWELRQALKEVGMEPALATRLRKDLTQSGILRRTSKPDYFFLHLTLQEYLAASAIARLINEKGWETEVEIDGKRKTLRQLVNSKAWDLRYQEVIVSLAGQLKNPAPLLELLADERQDDYFGHRLALAARCLPELNFAIRTSQSEIVDRITTAAFALWWRRNVEGALDAVPHLSRALPALGQVNGCVSSSAFIKSAQKQPSLPLLDLVVRWFRQEVHMPWPLSLDQPSLLFLDLVTELLRDNRYYGNEAAEAAGMLGAAATPTNLAALAALLRDAAWSYGHSEAAEAVGKLGAAAATPEFLAALAALLRDDKREVRNEAAYVVGKLGAAAATPMILAALAALLRDAAWSYGHSEAAEAVGKLGAAAATPAILAALAALLRDDESKVRNEAAYAVGKLGAAAATPEFLAALATLLRDAEEGVRDTAAYAVGKLGAAAATPTILAALVALLRDTRGYYCDSAAAETVGKLGAAAATPEFLAALAALLRDADGNVRGAAAYAVGELGVAAATPTILAALATLLRDAEWDVRAPAAYAVGNLGVAAATPEFLATLVALLRDAEWVVRFAAACAVGNLGAAAATPTILAALATWLRDAEKDVRDAAAELVGDLGTAAATPTILAALAALLRDAEEDVRRAAGYAVGELGAAAATPEFLAALAALLRDAEEDVRRAAGYAVGELGAAAATPEFLAALAVLLRDAEEGVRDTAAHAVGKLGAAAATEPILAALAALLRDADEYMRYVAAEAVGKLGAAAATPVILAALAGWRDDRLALNRSAVEAMAQLMAQGARIFEVGRGKFEAQSVAELSQ